MKNKDSARRRKGRKHGACHFQDGKLIIFTFLHQFVEIDGKLSNFLVIIFDKPAAQER